MSNQDSSQYTLRYNEITEGLEFAQGNYWVPITGSVTGVTSFNTLTGAVTISAGSGITLTPTGNDISIASTGGSPGGANTSVQFNNTGAFDGFGTWDGSILGLAFAGSVAAGELDALDENEAFRVAITGSSTSGFIVVHDSLPLEISALGASIGSTLPDISAKLDVQSTTSGFLPPRMTTTQRDAISTPAEGLQIWNTTTHLPNWFDGTIWQTVTLTPA